MPEPIITPVRSRSSSLSGCQPASSTACAAAAIAKMMNSSMRRWSLGGTQSSALNRPGLAVAARHLPGDARRQVGDIEGLDRADPQFAREEPAPDPLEADAERRHEPHAGDDDAPHAGKLRPEPHDERARRADAVRRADAAWNARGTFSYAPR